MADAKRIETMTTGLKAILSIPVESLVKNANWGTIDFEKARRDLELANALSSQLLSLPIELLPDTTADDFNNRITAVQTHIDRIAEFDIERSGNPRQERDELVQQIRQSTESFLIGVQGWIGFLAYQKGDVQKNISALTQAVGDAKTILTKAKGDTETKAGEISEIIRVAREASASVGVGVFTSDFATQAGTFEIEASTWLKWTFWLALVTTAIGVLSFFVPIEKDATSPQVIQALSSRLVVILLLLTATIWCGRLYKAARHQAVVNMHRANSLKTFQAFVKAAATDPTRDAVLLETTRSIFALSPSGYLDMADASGETSTRIFEVVKNATSGPGPAK